MENEAFHFLVSCLPPRGQGIFFSCSLAPKIGWDRHLLLLASRSLPFPLLDTNNTPFYQLGYHLGRFGLVVRLKSVAIICQLWQSFSYLLVLCDDRPQLQAWFYQPFIHLGNIDLTYLG
jgi:hypothetical protein